MTSSKLTPSKLRLLLSLSLFATFILAGVIFHFANSSLKTMATSVSHKVADADASRNNLENLKRIEKFLNEEQDSIERVNNVVADSKSYQYQDQIILDLNAYAAKAGISITDYDFRNAASGAGAAPAAPAAGTTPPATAAAPLTGSVKSTSASITVGNPINYENLLKFVKYVEQNLTKMQISKIGLSKDPSTNDLTADSLTIEIYVR